jgi:hypothetical protein
VHSVERLQNVPPAATQASDGTLQFTSKLEDLDYADDIALLSSTKYQMQRKSNLLNTYSMLA